MAPGTGGCGLGGKGGRLARDKPAFRRARRGQRCAPGRESRCVGMRQVTTIARVSLQSWRITLYLETRSRRAADESPVAHDLGPISRADLGPISADLGASHMRDFSSSLLLQRGRWLAPHPHWVAVLALYEQCDWLLLCSELACSESGAVCGGVVWYMRYVEGGGSVRLLPSRWWWRRFNGFIK